MKAATAQLSRDATTRLVQTCTGHPISAEALGRMRNLIGIEAKFKEWEKTLINAQKEQIPLLGIWLSIEQKIRESSTFKTSRKKDFRPTRFSHTVKQCYQGKDSRKIS